ncbi:MAG: branched-chain amino acid ABC transporter permease [Actinomycetales bacterium]|nr:branched-chain amino acid ABC transporter permease [Candidatus Lutibacillus vidarii]HRB98736.1 branched-chain amino acid ABC transporter permease [Dermatophilaceae bacterium]
MAAEQLRYRPTVRTATPWALGVLLVAAALALQTQLYTGQARTVTAIFMYVALALSWNLIGGYTGYASFGQVVFFGIGGYFTAVAMTHLGWSFWVALVASGLFAACYGALVGIPLLRLRGHYFAIATLGMAEGTREIVTNLPELTGGGGGITLPTVGAAATTPYLGNDGFYVLFLALAAIALLVTGVISRSKFGFALRAIHQDEDAAAAIGINTTRTKVVTFALSGFLAGMVGSAYAFQQVTIYPERLFDVEITVLMVVMVVIGGSGTVIGPVIGAVALQFVSEWLRQNYTDIHTLLLGGIIILAVILLPQGLANYVREARRTGEYSLLANVRRYRL